MNEKTIFEEITQYNKHIEVRGFKFYIQNYNYEVSSRGYICAVTKDDVSLEVWVGKSKLKIPSKYHSLIMYYAKEIREKRAVPMKNGGVKMVDKIIVTVDKIIIMVDKSN